MAIKVTLRKKPISKGRYSLYLDFYPAVFIEQTGKYSRREFLKMYVFQKPKNFLDKRHNEETLIIAKGIRQKRENSLNKPEIYTEYERELLRIKQLGEKCFVEYFTELSQKRKSSNYDNWVSTLNYLKEFTRGHLKFKDLNESILNQFKDYLQTTKSRKGKNPSIRLSTNSAASYFNKVKAALRQAYSDGLLVDDLNRKIPSIKPKETRREYLTFEELEILINTHCANVLIKKAAIFSALSGLRFSDIEKLRWSEIETINEKGHFINFEQKKTGSIEVLPIPKQAFDLLNSLPKNNLEVFHGLKYSAYNNQLLKNWIEAANISKRITFHCFRHTYATLQLHQGTDLLTISKLLGHKNIQTTLIYTKVMDSKKIEAANRLSLKNL